jgi:hypothetical protein
MREFRILCSGVALILGIHFPAYGSHGVSDVGHNSAAASESELKMLGLTKDIDIIDPSPGKNCPFTGPDCARAGKSAYGDIAFDCERYIGDHHPLSRRPFWHFKSQRRPVEYLEFGRDTVGHLASWCLSGIDYHDVNGECVPPVARANFTFLYADVGPQLMFGGSIRQLDGRSGGGCGIPSRPSHSN